VDSYLKKQLNIFMRMNNMYLCILLIAKWLNADWGRGLKIMA